MSGDKPYEPTVRNPIGGDNKGIITYKHGAVNAIFPKVCIIRTGNTISITTAVRKKADDGKWHKNIVFSVFNAKPPHPLSDADVHTLIEMFNYNLYAYVLFGKAGEWKNAEGMVMSGIDDDQRSEEERLGIKLIKEKEDEEEEAKSD